MIRAEKKRDKIEVIIRGLGDEVIEECISLTQHLLQVLDENDQFAFSIILMLEVMDSSENEVHNEIVSLLMDLLTVLPGNDSEEKLFYLQELKNTLEGENK